MAKNYTTKTASLKATMADMNKANVKKLDADKIKIKGQNIEELWGLNLPQDYAKFITRCELPEDVSWRILDDNGKTLYSYVASTLINGTDLLKDSDV